MKKLLLILFVVVSLGELIAGFIDVPELHLVCKPMILLTLGAYYWVSAGHRNTLVLLAIFFSLAGDVLLMFDAGNELFFIFGLLAFLTSHLFYIFVYRQHQWPAVEDKLKGIQKIRLAFPIVLAGTGLMVVLYDALGPLKIPVMVYALVLVVMVLNALFRYGRTSPKSFRLVFGGAVFFMLSDSLLAINKFLTPLANSATWIMLTYIVAQYCIVSGLLDHDSEPDAQRD
ncbi:lysoplasmalogenase [Chryseolinea lacunae]|uniref:Lysoplasmalogenase n=1 Tax=Chryseolinea lacunae TaxID=2801331 RepID=A0ABS1L0L8_9BACT|nr:lysoplasmalogenase [Chryseolinea lacunae]MBL0745062.1 lysoplasmalogenase [Chryseolinea lacunae]